MIHRGKGRMIHKCVQSASSPWTTENRGDGWYLYSGSDRGASPVRFCPGCGVNLSIEGLGIVDE